MQISINLLAHIGMRLKLRFFALGNGAISVCRPYERICLTSSTAPATCAELSFTSDCGIFVEKSACIGATLPLDLSPLLHGLL